MSPLGAGAPSSRSGNQVAHREITKGIIEAVGMRLVAGRTFASADLSHPETPGILSESGLRQVWPALRPAEAIGRMLDLPGEAPRQVIGIASDVRSDYANAPFPSLYVPVGPQRPARRYRAF